jgi:hypothetical protein
MRGRRFRVGYTIQGPEEAEMSDPRAIPDEERPMIPEELVPRQESDDPVDAGATATSGRSESDADDQDEDVSIDVEDLP